MRFLIRLFLICAALLVATIAFGNLAERWVIYPFDPRVVDPADAGLPDVTAHHVAVNDETLTVWTHPPKRGRPVIFYLHGNAGNLAARAQRFQRFVARGYGLVAPAYRGSSGSTGSPAEDAIIADTRAVYDRIDRLLALETHPPVIVYGESLGTAVTIALAASGPTPAPAAIILEAPFTSIADLSEYHYPGTLALAKKLDNTWPSLQRAADLSMPLLVIHGTNDTLIPIEMGRQIYSAAPSREKSFVTVRGAGHTDLWRASTLSRLWRFIDAYWVR